MSEERWEIRDIWEKTGRKWEGVRILGDQSGQGIVYVVRNAAREAEREKAGNAVHRFRLQDFGYDKKSGASDADVAQEVVDAFSRLSKEPPNTLGVLKRYFIRASSDSAQTDARFQREVQTLETLAGNPAVLRPLGAKRSDWTGPDWMVTEYHEQRSLDARRDGKWVHRGRFTGKVRASLEALCPIIEVAAKMHSDTPGKPIQRVTVHRDIKPANILVADDGHLVLGDFGIVHVDQPGATRPTRFEEVVGPADFMPPWRSIAELRADVVLPLDDVYMLGKVLWWMLTSGSLNREWHDRPTFNLVTLFPDEPWMTRINDDILSRCVVDDEAKCELKNAGDLLKVVQEHLHILRHGGVTLDSRILRSCGVCGQGKYVPVQQPAHEETEPKVRLVAVPLTQSLAPKNREGVQPDQITTWFNPVNPDGFAAFVFSCDMCGHVQFFRAEWGGSADSTKPLPAWTWPGRRA